MNQSPAALAASVDDHGLDAPVRLGRYALLKLIAAGGMAGVYLARHGAIEGFNKLVVIKRIHQHLALDARFVDMFFDEARIAASLNHPNIVQIFDLGRVAGFPFITMEYVEGVSLREMHDTTVKAGRPMPWQLVAWLGARAAEALAHAHALTDEQGNNAGLVHRDVSPQNLLVSFEGDVKLVDFGIARASIRLEQTQSFSRKGKLRYMSPEQILGIPLDHRSDLFSLGVVLWEMVSNRRLFDAPGELAVMKQVTEAPIPEPHPEGQHLPTGFVDVLNKLLEREAEDRFEDGAQVAEALGGVMLEASVAPSARQMSTYVGGLFAKRIEDVRREVQELNALDLSELMQDAPPPIDVVPTAAETAANASGHNWSVRGVLGPAVVVGLLLITLTWWGVLGPGSTLLSEDPPPGRKEAAVVLAPAVAAKEIAPEAPVPKAVVLPAPGELSVTSTPPGATIILDGEVALGTTPLKRHSVEAGAHRVRLTLRGYRNRDVGFTIAEGKPRKLVATMRALPKPMGRLTLDTKPYATVYFNGRKIADTPLVGVKLPAGKQVLSLRVNGKLPARQITVDIKAGNLTTQSVDFR